MTVPPLVYEATRKGGVVWVAAGGQPPRAVWHVWHDGADHVLHGGGEQEVPGLVGATAAEVVVRSKHTGAGLLTWRAAVTTVAPGSVDWLALEPLLRKARLHAEADPTSRWRERATLSRLTPTGEVS